MCSNCLNGTDQRQFYFSRGIERRKVFRNDADRDDFLGRLELILVEIQTPCYAWALIHLQQRRVHGNGRPPP
jgi:hypothetical protein